MGNDDFFEALHSFDDIYQKTNHLYGNGYTLDASRMKMANLQKKIEDKHAFVDSLEGCDVSIEIAGEWNVIRNDIRELLSKTSYEINGYCTRVLDFVGREQEHLNSIKEKVGKISIECQMISAIVAQAVVLDCESNMIEAEPIKGVGAAAHGDYVAGVVYKRALTDCINALKKVSLFDMEYQYKIESFTPTYKEFLKMGWKAGLIDAKEVFPKNDTNTNTKTNTNSGCMGIVLIGIITTTIFILLI